MTRTKKPALPHTGFSSTELPRGPSGALSFTSRLSLAPEGVIALVLLSCLVKEPGMSTRNLVQPIDHIRAVRDRKQELGLELSRVVAPKTPQHCCAFFYYGCTSKYTQYMLQEPILNLGPPNPSSKPDSWFTV